MASTRPPFLFLSLLLLSLLLVAPISAGRDVVALTQWAKDNGVKMHENLKWKDYGDEDWGLILTKPVERGTVLLKVPRELILDSTVLKRKHTETECAQVIEALGQFAIHEENFWIVLELYKLKCQSSQNWSPWLAAMPESFPQFTKEEIDCLPFYAKYAAEYQEKKFAAFCQAVEALEGTEFSEQNVPTLKWAFQAVNSRFWKTNPIYVKKEEAMATAQPLLDVGPTSELVPLGDMMNHREPPNVQMVPEDLDHVTFGYLGDKADKDSTDDENYERDLFISYGQPGNPHRFLVIFGFVPGVDSMPNVWSHVIYGETNPYSKEVDKMVFDAKDGTISQQVWDAILWEIWQPASLEEFLQGKDAKHAQYKHLTSDVLKTHVTQQLDEFRSLRPKLETTEGPNMALIRQHNDFLTSVFSKVLDNLNDIQ